MIHARLSSRLGRLGRLGRLARSPLAVAFALLLSRSASAQPITPAEAIEQAAGGSPTLRAAMHDALASLEGLAIEEQLRVPVFVAGVDAQYNERFANTSRGGTRNANQSIGSDVGLRYTTDIGTQLGFSIGSSVGWQTTNINPATTESVTVGPAYQGTVGLEARQPLLRGAGTDANLAGVRAAEASITQADRTRDDAASLLVQDVLRAYYDLWYAQEALVVQREARALARRQHEDAKLRAEHLGITAPIDALQFETQLAAADETLVTAEMNRRTRAIELGRLLGLPTVRAITLSAANAPPAPSAPPPLSELTDQARRASSELAAMEAQLDVARERLRAAADADQPRLDLIAQVSMAGQWSDDELPGLALPGGRPAFAAIGGLELEVPLGRGQASAAHAQAQAQLAASTARFQARSEAIDAEIASLRLQLEATAEQVALTTRTAEVSQRLADAEAQRVELGTSTPAELVRVQQTQREAELRRLRALADHAAAQLQLAHRIGDLLPRIARHLRTEPEQ